MRSFCATVYKEMFLFSMQARTQAKHLNFKEEGSIFQEMKRIFRNPGKRLVGHRSAYFEYGTE